MMMANRRVLEAIALTVILGGRGAQAQTPIPPSPKDFVMAASQSDQYEILAASVALVQGQDPHVRTFAQEMILDHSHLSEELNDQAMLLSSLQSLRGRDFDRTYARQQELAHAQAEAVEDSFAMAGTDSNLRKAARSALPSIRDHLKKAQQLLVDLGGS
jgi:putative membrane protein